MSPHLCLAAPASQPSPIPSSQTVARVELLIPAEEQQGSDFHAAGDLETSHGDETPGVSPTADGLGSGWLFGAAGRLADLSTPRAPRVLSPTSVSMSRAHAVRASYVRYGQAYALNVNVPCSSRSPHFA